MVCTLAMMMHIMTAKHIIQREQVFIWNSLESALAQGIRNFLTVCLKHLAKVKKNQHILPSYKVQAGCYISSLIRSSSVRDRLHLQLN